MGSSVCQTVERKLEYKIQGRRRKAICLLLFMYLGKYFYLFSLEKCFDVI
jgi:hypothetical protein